MTASSVHPSLAFAVELEQRDEAVAARLETLAALDRRLGELRARAERVSAFGERLPADRAHLDSAVAEAELDLAAARDTLAQAQAALERARTEDARTTGRRHEAHAATDVHTSQERRDRLVGRQETLVREAHEAESESSALAGSARELSIELEGAPRVAQPEPPAPGVPGVLEWVARAHAALFVARSGLEAERERVVREANELAASVLDEPLYATSVATVRRRLEAELGGA